METLPQELLVEITRRLKVSHAARWAQTSKTFNSLVWTFITTLNEEELKHIDENTSLEKFKNIEELSLGTTSRVVPNDLVKLTKLQNLQVNLHTDKNTRTVLQKLTNLRKLSALLKESRESLDDLLQDHTKLTYFYLSADHIDEMDALSWDIMTRLRYLKMNENTYERFSSNEFLQKLWTLTQLRGLSLSGIHLMQRMESGLSNLTNLEELDIYGCKSRDINSNWFVNYNELLDLRKLTNLAVMDVDLNDRLTNIISKLPQLVQLDLFEMSEEYELGLYSNLTNLKRIWFGLDIVKSDLGLEFKKMTDFEVVSIPWCQNVTQLAQLKKLRELVLRKGNHDPDENELSFLKEMTILQSLTISGDSIPSDGFVDLEGMTNLNYLAIFMTSAVSKGTIAAFIKYLSVLPSLSKLVFENYFEEEWMPLIAELTQVQVLKLPKRAQHFQQQQVYHFTLEFQSY